MNYDVHYYIISSKVIHGQHFQTKKIFFFFLICMTLLRNCGKCTFIVNLWMFKFRVLVLVALYNYNSSCTVFTDYLKRLRSLSTPLHHVQYHLQPWFCSVMSPFGSIRTAHKMVYVGLHMTKIQFYGQIWAIINYFAFFSVGYYERHNFATKRIKQSIFSNWRPFWCKKLPQIVKYNDGQTVTWVTDSHKNFWKV